MVILLFSLPVMQKNLASWTASVLEGQLDSKVEIGSINIGFLNKLIVNDVVIYEPSGKKMVQVARVGASVNLISLLSGKIEINTAQLFGTNATLYKETPDSKPNYQFLLDAFSSDKDDEESEIDFCLNSLIMRHTSVRYDVKSEIFKPGVFDVNHLYLKDCGMDLVIKCLTNDSINLSVKRLQAKEDNSGLKVNDTRLALCGNTHDAMIKGVHVELPHSFVSIDSLLVQYDNYKEDKSYAFNRTSVIGQVTLSDFKPFYSKFNSFTEPINFDIDLEGSEKQINVHHILINNSDESLLFTASCSIVAPLTDESRIISANITKLYISDEEKSAIADAIGLNEDQIAPLLALGDLNYEGQLVASNNGIESDGLIVCSAGELEYNLNLNDDKFLTCNIQADSLNIGKILNQEKLASTSFDLDLSANLADKAEIPTGSVKGEIYNISYNEYNLKNIVIDAISTETAIVGSLSIDDESLVCSSEFDIKKHVKEINANLMLDKFIPHNLDLVSDKYNEDYSFMLDANLYGVDYDHLLGKVKLSDLKVTNPKQSFYVDDITVIAEDLGDKSLYCISSDILNGTIEGKVGLSEIFKSIKNQIAVHLPVLVQPEEIHDTGFDYDLTINDSPILHHFTDIDFEMNEPIHINGEVSSVANRLSMNLDAPVVTYSGNEYTDVLLTCNSSANVMNLSATASSFKPSDEDDEPDKSTKLDVKAQIHNNRIVSNLLFDAKGRNNVSLNLLPTITLSDSLGSTKTVISFAKSNSVINDTTWTAYPSNVLLYKKIVECNGVKFANNTNSVISIEGRASSNPHDSIVATLKNLEIKYVLPIVDFDAVRFGGKASGKAILNNLMGDGMPDFVANLNVKNFTLQDGSLGDAMIQANWDKSIDAVKLNAYFIDHYDVKNIYTSQASPITGITSLDGWISPSKNDMRLDLQTDNTNAAFLHGFLNGVFKELNGSISGPISIIGPLNDVNLVGAAVPDLHVRLRATNVPYHIFGDTLRLRPYTFDYKDVSISDKYGNKSKIDAEITHKNFKNFRYSIMAHMKGLCAYDETTFNSDKFLATVFADGELSVNGADGHPLYVNADITPTKGSVFAYDAATPDAIIGNGFIEFADRDSLNAFPLFTENSINITSTDKDSLTIAKEAKKNYNSDIYLNINAHLTPACEVKLRMDNLDDGYMHTFGYADLTAKWYNKGAFQLFGNYNINSGSYRLYLQDIIFRDLAIQPGSQVEFNGNPFDANIHLLCHHAINSVPLSDLTNTTAFSSNNKVKVICVLDITGKLGNMDFTFDMDLPNVSEEVKQLVRSMINSEEEMNTQMIYLLGVGRFYPNEYARANGGDNSGQAVNSLLSSTISGQINQMLSNVIGTKSNWNFGSSLTTGEKGWDDLDIEGILSGRLMDDRLLLNGNFGYRDNALTNQANFIGDFEVKWKIIESGDLYLKGYNQTNDRYFTKATINTQGLGISWQHDFETFRKKINNEAEDKKKKKTIETEEIEK